MNEKLIQSIKNALKDAVTFILQSDEPLTPELELKLAQAIEHAANRIQELRQEQEMEAKADQEIKSIEQEIVQPEQRTQELSVSNEQIPELEPTEYPSSNINAFRYDPKNQNLYVKFQDKYPAQNGPVYKYEQVPQYIFNILSKGSVVPKTSGKNKWHRWRKGIAPSHGASMAALVKAGQFKYTKLS